jgi:hypothetical protein
MRLVGRGARALAAAVLPLLPDGAALTLKFWLAAGVVTGITVVLLAR